MNSVIFYFADFRAHEANSHAKFGWHAFTDDVIRLISDQATQLVFLLWGGFAHKKEKLIDQVCYLHELT